ncbi:restriction endonuclease [Microvirga sp. 3-52]|uniref:restriction endonuclease n=1 Tax=Microvirga sp. 3-52 TaxID=2792425 RepID=UPI001AC06FA2|nr:restriction endonuclease [Microvirga sp. 3-52]MBO1907017.1 restriction endonuclease [Microvirga sp. 3-52]MBS7454814.1 restriction endonuclease [Microvirga sp. 3-52]
MPRLITSRTPGTWQELETTVRDILRECGMQAECQVTLTLPRGSANIDVLAEDRVEGIVHKIICECKNWTAAIPQHVVHAFRTVVHEAGANRGYIISKAGFQSGSIEAASSTNIELVTFEEFQDIFFERWLKAQSWALENNYGGFNTYYEPFGIPGIHRLEDETEIREYQEIHRHYLYLGLILPSFSPYRWITGGAWPTLPFDCTRIEAHGIHVPEDIKAATAYRELFQALEAHVDEGLRALRKRNPITRNQPYDSIERDD